MAYSDDESEDLPQFVSNYFFEDDSQDISSFVGLPIIWNTSETMQNLKKQLYIKGTTDDGLQSIYKPVKAWKFDLSGERPEISVLSKDNNWMKLQKPRKSFEAVIRNVLITVRLLHLVKNNPQLNEKSIWHKLSRIFSSYEVRPSDKDLLGCKPIIEEAVKRDEQLMNSEYLLTFFGKKPQKRKRADEDVLNKGKREFIVDDNDFTNDAESASDESEADSSEEEDDDQEAFDSVCCICDNGGSLLCCEGSCMRSFHGTAIAAEDAESACKSLGFTEKEVKDMANFKCKNCLHMRHQCFSCGKLGSSDKSSGAEVFQCVNATCGYFYHPHCVANLLHRDNGNAAKELQDRIFAGESFTCPLHTCIVCKQPEDKSAAGLQMAVCRRCPKAYHEKCLPRKIAFEEDEEQGIIQRAWRGLLVDRILIYCLKHEILEDIGTPRRDHIKFPDDGKERLSSAAPKVGSKKKVASVGETSESGTAAVQSKKKAVLESHSDKRKAPNISKLKSPDASSGLPTEKKCLVAKAGGSVTAESKKISTQHFERVKPAKVDKLTEGELMKKTKADVKKLDPELDSESEKRILAIMEEAASIITLGDIIDNHAELISARQSKAKAEKYKNITQGKVEGSCKAVREAVKKMARSGNIEEAKAICEPKVLEQVDKWKNTLKVYLAPFLFGMRYTSYGRHFTKKDKLKEIVDKIHWYVNEGDTIVDFGCGANDFSWLMKQKLEEMGKNCSFKNYDKFPQQNDFCFEKRDWMTVQPKELPPGSQLIMGLNPPFGVKASLANEFIDHALEFKPKLLILIVPPETERLDKKKTPYDLIWEDTEKLSGKSFYLPGSVDVNDKQMEDWNVVTPVLYLWSHPQWTNKHKAIAQKQGHLPVERGNHKNNLVRDSPLKKKPKLDDAQKGRDAAVVAEVADSVAEVGPTAQAKQTATTGLITETPKSRAAPDHEGGQKHPNESRRSNSIDDVGPSRKRRLSEEKHQVRRSAEGPPEHRKRHSSPSNSDQHRGRPSSYLANHQGGPRRSPVNSRHSLEERYSSVHQGAPSNAGAETRDASYEQQVNSTSFSYDYERGRRNRGDQEAYHDRRVRGYGQPEHDPYLSVTERYSVDLRPPRPGEFAPAYPRDHERYPLDQLPPPSEPDPRYTNTYSMEPSYSRMNYVPTTERYNLRLDNAGPNMAHNAGGHPYQYPGPPQLGYPHDYMGYRPGHYNPHPPPPY